MFLCIGEPLVEFTNAPEAPSRFDRRAGGDTLNTAIYLARLLGPGKVGYLSRLGDDAMSDYLRRTLSEEGITDLCATEAAGRPGLSFIATDSLGERSFTYWREHSPARRLFSSDDEVQTLHRAKTLVLSGVTLAMLLPQGRANLLCALKDHRDRGGEIVLDTNYRASLWSDAATARDIIGRAARLSTLVLPSQDDIASCFDISDTADGMHFLMELTEAEIVLTTGGGAVLHRGAHSASFDVWPVPPRRVAKDTTGAGDSFNAGWLAARLAGCCPADAIARAAQLAAEVVGHPGAILPRAAMPSATKAPT